MELIHVDLFSGTGGFAFAVERVGFKTVVFCEKDEFCQKILRKHWSKVPIIPEIRDFDGTKWQGATLLTGGFPCQPFSVAGKRRGKEDDRYLWPEMFRIIKEAKPRWVIAENVTGIVKMVLGEVLSDLEGIGYDFPRDHEGTPIVPVIPACGLNAPHRRNRIWIVAHARKQERNWLSSISRQKMAEARRKNQDASDSNQFPKGQDARDGCPESDWQKDWYEVATRFCRVDDGVSRELDFIRGVNEYFNNKKSKSEIGFIIWKILRIMWKYRKLAKTSPRIYSRKLQDCVPEMPYKNTHGRWNLGQRIEEDKRLCDMWETFYSKSFNEAQDLQSKLLEYLGKIECRKKMEKNQRVDRLKALGNAIVPQVAEMIMGMIWKIEKNACEVEEREVEDE